ARLREVASELLGPLRWSAASHPDDPSAGWNPTCLGIDKRLLLRHEVLREISRSRTPGNQQLVQELLELCK
ncbi:protein HIRA, partial [Haematococcus lacustris]